MQSRYQKPSAQLVLDAINAGNETHYTLADVQLINLTANPAGHGERNTQVTVQSLGDSGDAVVVYYERPPLSAIVDGYDSAIAFDPDYRTTLDLLNVINQTYGAALSAADVEKEDLEVGSEGGEVTLTAKPECLAFIGSMTLQIKPQSDSVQDGAESPDSGTQEVTDNTQHSAETEGDTEVQDQTDATHPHDNEKE